MSWFRVFYHGAGRENSSHQGCLATIHGQKATIGKNIGFPNTIPFTMDDENAKLNLYFAYIEYEDGMTYGNGKTLFDITVEPNGNLLMVHKSFNKNHEFTIRCIKQG